MDNKKRLIDANALDEKLETLKVRFKALGKDAVVDDYNFVQTVLLTAPTVDAVEVVRCRDCKYFSRDEEYNRAWCNYYTGCIETAVNGYCYHGAKMDGGNEDEID